MKKIVILILFCLAQIGFYGQEQEEPAEICGFDEYFQSMLVEYPNYMDSLTSISTALQRESDDDNFIIYIPIVFHVVYNSNNSSVNISDQQILSQLNVLNAAFSNSNLHANGVNTRIIFCLARQGPTGAPSTGITRYGNGQDKYDIANSADVAALKATHYWTSTHYLNVWICNLYKNGNPVKGGESTFPLMVGGAPVNPQLDGIMINSQYCGDNIGTATITNFSHGKILVHEVGHWLGLFHVFEKSIPGVNCNNCLNTDCNITGDEICDTEPCRDPANIDPYWNTGADRTKRYTCNTSCMSVNPLISAENYMDYNWTQYMNYFSPQQKARMRNMCDLYRNYFYSNSKNNPGLFPIECNTNDVGTGGSSTESKPCHLCENRKYPDEWMQLNGQTSSHVELCVGTKPMINIAAPGFCTKFPLFKHYKKCSDEDNFQDNFDGNCMNMNECKWVCEKADACHCFEFIRRMHIVLEYGCDDNFNCPYRIERWYYFTEHTIDCDYDVFAKFGFSGDQNNTRGNYKIMLGTFDPSGTGRLGIKYVHYVPFDVTFPFSGTGFLTGYAASNQKAMNNITFAGTCFIPNNSQYIAGNEIRLKDETSMPGLIESVFKIDNVYCHQTLQKIVNQDTINSHQNTSTFNDHYNWDNSEEDEANFHDYYFKTFEENSGVKMNDSRILTLMPNPSSSGVFSFTIEGNKHHVSSIKVYNTAFQHLGNIDAERDINLQTYPNGIYFLEFRIDGNYIYKKAIKN